MSSQRATKWIPVYEPVLGELEEELVADCVRSGWVSSKGKYVTQFESEFAAFCGTKHGVATSNGTTALHLALLALGVGVGDEIIVPSLTFVATANAVVHAGATPVFADSERLSWNVDPVSVETMITPRTRGIIAVHLYGHPCDMPAILRLATEHGLFVIEDCAEAHGATSGANRVGSMGTIGCFSFYGNKILTTGEGGMCLTPNDELADRMRMLRDHGMSPDRRYWHPVVGFNYRLTNIQAALGVAQLSRLEETIKRKREIAHIYGEILGTTEGLQLAPELPGFTNVYWMYSVLVEDSFGVSRDEVISELEQAEIESRPFFHPNHTLPPYASDLSLPVAEDLAARGLNLPSGPGLTDSQVQQVAETVVGLRGRQGRL